MLDRKRNLCRLRQTIVLAEIHGGRLDSHALRGQGRRESRLEGRQRGGSIIVVRGQDVHAVDTAGIARECSVRARHVGGKLHPGALWHVAARHQALGIDASGCAHGTRLSMSTTFDSPHRARQLC